MGALNKSGSPFAINCLNLVIRFLQLAFGAIVLGIYAEAKSHATWTDADKALSILRNLAIAAGALSIITGVIFSVIPFLISYYYVAMAFLWDAILFFVWAATFAITHRHFGDKQYMDMLKKYDWPSVSPIVTGQWFALASMILFLFSALMGMGCLLADRKSLCASRRASA